MASPAGGDLDLSNIKLGDSNTLLHVLCLDREKFATTVKDGAKKLTGVSRQSLYQVANECKGQPPKVVLGYLLQRKCDINALNGKCKTPLDLVISGKGSLSKPEDVEWIDTLVQHGASPTHALLLWALQRNSKGKRPSDNMSPNCVPFSFSQDYRRESFHILIDILMHPQNHRNTREDVLVVEFLENIVRSFDSTSDYGHTLFLFTSKLCQPMSEQSISFIQHVETPSREQLIGIFKSLVHVARDGVNYRDERDGVTPLHICTEEGQHEMAALLLEHPNINVNIQDEAGTTALSSCLKAMLKREIWRDARLPMYLTTLTALIARREVEIASLDKEGASALVRCIKLLGSVEPFYKDADYYRTILDRTRADIHVPVTENYGVVLLLARNNQYKTLEKIIKELHRDQLRATEGQSRNALHVAAQQGHVETIRVLIQHEEKLQLCNMRDVNGNTPLFYLVRTCNERDVINLLDNPNWDFTMVNNVSQNVLDFYKAPKTKKRQRATVIDLLKQKLKEADDNMKNPRSQKLRRGAEMSRTVNWPKTMVDREYTPLPARGDTKKRPKCPPAAEGRRLCDVLCDMETLRQVYQNLCDKSGDCINEKHEKKTPLMWCALSDLPEELGYLYKTHSEGLDCCEKDDEGRTALHLAANHHSVGCVKILTQQMPPDAVNLPDSKGNTALFYICGEFPPEYVEEFIGPNSKWDYKWRNNARKTVLEHYLNLSNNRGKRKSKAPRTIDETIKNALEHYCSDAAPSKEDEVTDNEPTAPVQVTRRDSESQRSGTLSTSTSSSPIGTPSMVGHRRAPPDGGFPGSPVSLRPDGSSSAISMPSTAPSHSLPPSEAAPENEDEEEETGRKPFFSSAL